MINQQLKEKRCALANLGFCLLIGYLLLSSLIPPSTAPPPPPSTFRFCSFLREMGLWTLLEGFLLLANALAILNEDRFLTPRGWGLSDFSAGQTKSFKGQLIGLIYATQYLRFPLLLLNSVFIIVKLVSG
uniref:Yos1-like protein n=2 Tax=Glycine subgen. Soja TaxID=1462606 RepID=K7M581_SOYBN